MGLETGRSYRGLQIDYDGTIDHSTVYVDFDIKIPLLDKCVQSFICLGIMRVGSDVAFTLVVVVSVIHASFFLLLS